MPADPAQASAQDAKAARPECRNCGAPTEGAWCSSCGQETRLALPSAGTFLRESAGRYVALDGRLWRTLFALLFRPGFLTREYFAGRRRRYVRPSRLFLVLSIALFATLRLGVDTPYVGEPDAAHFGPPAPPATDPDPSGSAERGRDRGASAALRFDDEEIRVGLGDTPFSRAVRSRVEHFNSLPRREKAEQVYAGMLRYGPYALIALLPAFALLLKLLYLGRGGRYPGRPRRYAEHLVFGAHNHAFLCVALILALVPLAPVQAALAAWIVLYGVWSMRVVYGGRWSGLVLRAGVLLACYLVLFVLAMVGLIFTAVLLR